MHIDYLSIDKKNGQIDLPQWQKERLDVYLDEHNKGTAEYSDWVIEKGKLFKKFKHV